MKGIRLSTVVTCVAALSTGALLFSTSQKVQKAERQMASLEKQKDSEQEAIRVLRAEWDYLNRPDRLEAMATRFLGMKQPTLAAVTDDPDAIPTPIPAAVPPAPVLPPQPAVLHAAAAASPEQEQKKFQEMMTALGGKEGRE